MNRKTRRNSGRVWPRLLDKSLSLYLQPMWDDWVDWRDGMRFKYGKSWKDTTKKRKQCYKK